MYGTSVQFNCNFFSIPNNKKIQVAYIIVKNHNTGIPLDANVKNIENEFRFHEALSFDQNVIIKTCCA